MLNPKQALFGALATLFCSGLANAQDPIFADFSGSPTGGCTPLTVTFTNLSTSNFTTWSWNFGDGGTSTLKNPVHTYLSSGSFTVVLVATGPVTSDTETKADYIHVSTPAISEKLDQTLNPNPCSFTATPPVIGQTWTGTLNVALHEAIHGATPITSTIMFWQADFAPGAPYLHGGLGTEVWILASLGKSRACDPGQSCYGGGAATYTVNVPLDCALVGKSLLFQVGVFDSLLRVSWSNVIEQTGGTTAGASSTCP